ncbi:MAG: SDR family oxidoreductase [Acidimicrobiales bacterium]
MRLENKVAVVTGGGNGIGRATSIRFAEEGAAVVVADIQQDKAEETAAMIEAAGGRATAVRVDVVNRDDNDAMAQAAIDNYSGLDIVVTAAGISHATYKSGDIENEVKWLTERADYTDEPARAILDYDIEEIRTVMAVNLEGTFLGIQACLARMLDLGTGGSIVTIASIAAKHPDAGPLAYVCSKSAVWMLTKKLARELVTAKIRVNAIGPGFIETSMTAMIDLIPEELVADLWNNIPMARRGQPIDIANAALFLASDESAYFTGEILHPDGGYFTE